MRPPILWIAFAFGLGLAAGLLFFGDGGSGTGAGFVLLPVLVAALAIHRRAPLGAAVGVMAVAGVLWGGAAQRARAATCAGRWGRPARPAGSVAAIVRLTDPATLAGGVVDAAVQGGACGGPVRIRWPEGSAAHGGTTWLVAGRWLGTADRGVLVARRVRVLDPARRGRGAWRDRVAERSERLFGSRAPLVDALVIDRRAELDPAVRERYSRSGLAHILSISGLHVGFIAAWLALLLRRLGLRPRAQVVWSLVLIAAYLWLLGLPAPALRSAVMLAVLDIARLRQRIVAPRGFIGVAAIAVLFVDPWAIRSVGAWLSVIAVSAVIWGGRVVHGKPRWQRALLPSAAATLATAPITGWSFGVVAPIGIFANLVAIPVGAVAVPGVLLALLASWLSTGLATLLAAGSGVTLAALDLVARGAAAVPGGHVVSEPGWRAAALWTAIAAAAWWLWHAPRRPGLVGARVAFLVAILSWAVALDAHRAGDEDGRLTIHFLDVGQGDAAVLRTPAGRWIVVDGGPRVPGRDAGARVVVPFLKRHRAESVALLVATHGDADHLGGLPAVIDAFRPRMVLEPGEPLGRPLYLEFLAMVEESGAAWHPARAGDRIELDGVLLEVLSPDSAWVSQPMDVNEHSVVLRVTYGGVRVLLTGDAGLPVEERIAGRVGGVDLLKVGHHGSRSATGDAWLAELRPTWAVISVGRGNRYGHPAPEVLERLARQGITVFRTDRAGTITFVFDGQRAHTDIRHHD